MPFRKDASSTTNSTKTPKQTNNSIQKSATPKFISTSTSKSRFRSSRSSKSKSRSKQPSNDTASVSSASVMMKFLGLDTDRSHQIVSSSSSSYTPKKSSTKSSSSQTLKIANARLHHLNPISSSTSTSTLKRWGKKVPSSSSSSKESHQHCRFWNHTPYRRILVLMMMSSLIVVALFNRPSSYSYQYPSSKNEELHHGEYEDSLPDDPMIPSLSYNRKDAGSKNGIRGGGKGSQDGIIHQKDEIQKSIYDENESTVERTMTQTSLLQPKTNNAAIPISYDMSESLLPNQSPDKKEEMTINVHTEDANKKTRYDMASSLIDNLMKDDDDTTIPTKMMDDILDQNPSILINTETNSDKELQETIHPPSPSLSIENQSTQNLQPKDEIPNPPNPNPTKIAYVLPVYECPNLKPRDHTAPPPSDENYSDLPPEKLQDTAFLDAAAILKYTIHRNSIHNPTKVSPLQNSNKYSYQMVALVHPRVQQCFDVDGYSRIDALKLLGYDVRSMEIPVALEDMENKEYRHQVELAMESGSRDLIRLQAFALVEFECVVLVDLRTLIVDSSLEDLIDVVLLSQKQPDENDQNDTNENKQTKDLEAAIERVEWVDGSQPNPSTLPPISAIYTRDYSSVSPGKFNVGIYPGMVILKPSLSIYNEFVSILKTSDYRRDSGWGGSGIGGFWGDMTTRGILSYYYDALHPQHGLEVNRCRYNNMASNPFIRMNGSTVCRNQKEEAPLCQDCRDRSISIQQLYLQESNHGKEIESESPITVINVSACRDPWSCYHHSEHLEVLRLCRDMHSFWFKARRELEGAWEEHGGGGQFGYVPAELVKKEDRVRPEHFLGYCSGSGKDQYVPMTPPGKEVSKEGPALDTNAIMNQFATTTGTDSKDDGGNQIPKPKKHFDPMKVMFQFAQNVP